MLIVSNVLSALQLARIQDDTLRTSIEAGNYRVRVETKVKIAPFNRTAYDIDADAVVQELEKLIRAVRIAKGR